MSETERERKGQQRPMTSLEKKVRTILGAVFACAPDCPGHHHYESAWRRRRVDPWCIIVHLDRGNMATYDGSGLTRLVIGCHDEAVRVQITRSGPWHVGLVFSEREREGDFSKRHPTIEHAVEVYREIAKVSGASAGRTE